MISHPFHKQPEYPARISRRLLQYKPTLLWYGGQPIFNAATGAVGNQYLNSGTLTREHSPYGPGWAASAASGFQFPATDAIGNGDVTVLMYGAPVAAADFKIALFQSGAVGSMWFGANTDQNLGSISGQLCLGLLQTGVNRSSIKVAGAIDGTLSGYLIRKSGANGAAWKNGVAQSVTTSGTLTGSPAAAADTTEVVSLSSNGAYAFADPLFLVAAFKSALPDSLCVELSQISQGHRLLFEPIRRSYFVGISAGGTTDAVGSSAGTGAASGVGASTAASAASSAGVGAASGVGASTAASVGSSAGVGAASAVGEDAASGTTDAVGTSAGTGAASGVGASTAAAVATAAGVATAAAVAEALQTIEAVGSAAGVATVSGVGADAGIGSQQSIGSGPGWNIDFTGIENRIAEERADKEDRRRTIEQVFRRATGQPLPDDKPAEQVGAELLSAVKPAARKRMQAEIRAIAEIDASIARLEKQIEAADMAYLLAEERDIVWIVSEYI